MPQKINFDLNNIEKESFRYVGHFLVNIYKNILFYKYYNIFYKSSFLLKLPTQNKYSCKRSYSGFHFRILSKRNKIVVRSKVTQCKSKYFE